MNLNLDSAHRRRWGWCLWCCWAPGGLWDSSGGAGRACGGLALPPVGHKHKANETPLWAHAPVMWSAEVHCLGDVLRLRQRISRPEEEHRLAGRCQDRRILHRQTRTHKLHLPQAPPLCTIHDLHLRVTRRLSATPNQPHNDIIMRCHAHPTNRIMI